MNCEEYQTRYLASDLDQGSVQAHAAACAACRSAIPALDRLRRGLADPLLWEEPPPDLGDRVVAGIAGSDRAPSGGKAARRRLWWGGAAVAALALLAVGLTAVTGALSGPDWQLDLMSTDWAPGARAAVAGWAADNGTRMEFRVTGLERAPEGSYYEIWLTAPDGRHVSAGTFREEGRVSAWAGVYRRDFPRIWVTLEPVDQDLGPSSVVVFDTDVEV